MELITSALCMGKCLVSVFGREGQGRGGGGGGTAAKFTIKICWNLHSLPVR